MLAVALVAVAVGVLAAVLYLRRERLGAAGVGMAALRTVALAALVLLLVNPTRTERVTGGAPTVLLDASLSMDAVGGKWRPALDTARALARDGGVVWRFGASVASFDTTAPADGASLLRDALTAARAREGATIVVTDGEIEDASGLTPVLAPGTQVLRLPRDTVADVALLGADVPELVQRDDSVRATMTLGTYGPLAADSAEIEVLVGDRRLLTTVVDLPAAPGSARRSLHFPARLLGPGVHVIRLRVVADGDREDRDDERWRVVEVSAQPAVVVLVDPPDWEGRFLVQELTDIARTTVRGFARASRTTWLDMRTSNRVPEPDVRAAAAAAGLLVTRGRSAAATNGRRPVWHWPAGSDTRVEVFRGDWYLTTGTPVSPLAGRLAFVEWDSLPPLTGVVPLAPGRSDWVALTARQGRRGAERPVLVGRDSAGIRALTTAGEGLWRWRFRGGAAREAYRAVLAAGVDWLLSDDGGVRRAPLAVATVVERGNPVVFRWRGGDSIPDSVIVSVTGADSTREATLRFDAAGAAALSLEPGQYRWAAPAVGARGLAVVEPYSAEYPPRPVMSVPGVAREAFTLLERHPREWWWLFLVVVLAFAGEWAWRWRRGLP